MNERKAGILLSYLHFGVNSLIMLLYVPMLLHYVSKEQYGIYQMIGSFIGVIAVLDFGLCATVTRFVARTDSLHDEQQTQQILNAAAFLYWVLTGLLILIGIGGYFLIAPVYGAALSSADLATAQQIFLILLLNFAICVPGNLFLALLQAKEKFIFCRILWLVFVFITPLAIWGVLAWKASVVGVVWMQTLGNIGIVLGYYLYCKIRLRVRFVPQCHDKPLLKKLMGFSFFVFVGNLAGQLYGRLGPLVLGLLAGTLAVANYYIASQLLVTFSVVPSLINSVFLPKLSGDWVTTASLETQNDIFCKTGRLQGMVALLILTGFILLGKPFLLLWLGPGNEVCYPLALVLMCGAVVNIMQSVGPSVLMAINKYRYCALVGMGLAVLNMVLAFPFVKWYGTMGCAVSFTLCVGILNGVLMNLYYHQVGLQLRRFFAEVLPVAAWSVAALLVLSILWRVWPAEATWMSFCSHGVCIVAVYSALMALFVLNRFEWDILREIWQKVKQVAR